MKNLFMKAVLLILIAVCISSCSTSEKKYDVIVHVARDAAKVWLFKIIVNNDTEFMAKKCGVNNPDTEQCVVFNESNGWGNYYDYHLNLKTGDRIEVISSMTDCGAVPSLTCWIFVDGDVKAFDGTEEGQTIAMCSYTL